MEKEIIQNSSKTLKRKWNTKFFLHNSRFFFLEILSSIFSVLTGLIPDGTISTYPTIVHFTGFSENFGLGDILCGSISFGNFSGTIVSGINKSKRTKLIRICIMLLSIIFGVIGFIGISKITPVKANPFNQSTKYGLYTRDKN
jgi:hypothetical protein